MDCTPTHLAEIVKRWVGRGTAPPKYCGLDLIEMCDSVIHQDKPSVANDVAPSPCDNEEWMTALHNCGDLCGALIACSSIAGDAGHNPPYHPDGAPMERLHKIKETAEAAIADYNKTLTKAENEQPQKEA